MRNQADQIESAVHVPFNVFQNMLACFPRFFPHLACFLIGGPDNENDKLGNRVPWSCVGSCAPEICFPCRVCLGSVSRWCPVHFLLLFIFFCFFCLHFSSVSFFVFCFFHVFLFPIIFYMFFFSIVSAAMRFRVAALASGFILPTSLSSVFLVLWESLAFLLVFVRPLTTPSFWLVLRLRSPSFGLVIISFLSL